jgi:hypothetical protein
MSKAKEIWKEIEGYSGYEISNHGNVRCWNNQNGCGQRLTSPRPLKLSKFVGKNYYKVALKNKDGRKDRRIHQLVLEAFVGPRPTPKHVVLHLDDNGLNNYVDNLAWGTSQDNSDDMTSKGRSARGEKAALAKITEVQAKAIKSELVTDTAYGNMRRIARRLGVTYRTVTEIKYGNSWKHV